MPRDLLIRAAREDERGSLGALKLRSSLAWGDHIEELQALPEARELAAKLVPASFVAERSGEVVGFAAIVLGDDMDAELEELFVDPGVWRTGVGRSLVEEAIRRCAAQDARSLRVVANSRAVGFYQACGFERIGDVPTLFEPATLMQLRLEEPEGD